jgi:hypothetical protein
LPPRAPQARERASRLRARGVLNARVMRLAMLYMASALAACATSGDDGPRKLDPLPPPGKDDSQFHAGLATNIDSSLTDVWTVTRQWQDVEADAGLAWPANSGLTWDDKYRKWIESFQWTPGVDGWSTTYTLTTPFGKTLPAPSLECAETAMFLRIAFASWYGLPIMFEAQDDNGQRIYFGHFGIRTLTDRYTGMPQFATQYKDYTNSDWHTQWPHDAKLRARIIHGGDESQPELAPDATLGTYLDEMLLNKRVGYFTTLVLDYLGSVNLADVANTYNLQPEAVQPGDFLLERWQKNGIGHTLVVKEVTPVGTASFDVTLVSGSMPRRQGVKASGTAAKEYFTGPYTGGPGTASDGTPYVQLGGGLKRWRVAKAINGYWTNTWMDGDEAHWINSTDFDRLSARPARFEQLLGEVPLDQQKTELLAQIADARHHLSQYPSSCAARTQREVAFRQLYDVESRLEMKDGSQVDNEQRQLEDYVFGELDYTHSMTCCWDSSTSAMHDLIVAEAMADKVAADAAGTCTAPIVFEAQSGSYQRWADYAASVGRAADWKPYTDDEGCAAKGITTDQEASSSATPYCSLAQH